MTNFQDHGLKLAMSFWSFVYQIINNKAVIPLMMRHPFHFHLNTIMKVTVTMHREADIGLREIAVLLKLLSQTKRHP